MDDATLDRLLDGERFDADEGAVARLIALVGSASSPGTGATPPALTPRDLEAVGFRTLGLLGSGVHATVWDAQDATLGRRVALKVVRPQGTDLSAQRTFLREARMLARVDHPNVVRIWSAERSGERLTLALERIEGRTLREIVLREGPLEPRAAARIVLDVARGLAAVHAAGVLHRDLHPGNVMLRSEGSAVLLDFSLARGGGAEGLRRGGTMGTPAYEAPEVLRGGEPTERSDVYALGMLLVWLSTGRSPLRGSSWNALRASAVAGVRAPLAEIAPGMPRELRVVVERAIQVDPARRTPDARSFARELQAALGRKRRRAAFALGLVLAVGVAGGALEIVQRVRSSTWLEEEARHTRERHQRTKALDEMSRLEPPSPPAGLIELVGADAWDSKVQGFDGRRVEVPGDFELIQDALRAVGARGTVGVRGGEYRETLEIADTSVAIVSLDGPGAAELIGTGLDGPVVWVHAPESEAEHEVLLWGLSITGGIGHELNQNAGDGGDRYGGGVFVQGANLRVRLEACQLWGNGFEGATFGGALAARNSRDGDGVVSLVKCLIVRNAAWASGGAILADKARVVLDDCVVADNFSGAYGGTQGGIGLANGAELEVLRSDLWGNREAQIGEYEYAGDARSSWSTDDSRIQDSEGERLSLPGPFLDAESMDYRLRTVQGPAPQSSPQPWTRRIGASPRGVDLLGAWTQIERSHSAAVRRVPDQFSTIQAAIDGAPEGAIVLIAPGVYYERLELRAQRLTLIGEFGASATAIDVTHVDGPAVDVRGPDKEGMQRSEVAIQGLTVRGGNGRPGQARGRFGGALAVVGRVDLDLDGVVLWDSGLEASTTGGGGLWAASGADVDARNCLIARNEASKRGTALYVDDASVQLDHCTLIGLDGASKPLIHVAPAGHLEAKRSVLWGEAGSTMLDGPNLERIDVRDSLIRGGWDGPGVLDADPGFVDAANADWRRAESAGVGTGWGYRSPR